jgi:hypothetical protein
MMSGACFKSPTPILRQSACGRKGATIQHPGSAGEHIGFMPFPTLPRPLP